MKSNRELAEYFVPKNISYEEVANCVNSPQSLWVRIFDNKIYVLNGLRGEDRHADVLEQLFDLIKKGHSLPNTEFRYYTMDTVYIENVGRNGAVFTFFDDKAEKWFDRRILAPGFWFNGYRSGKFMNNSRKFTYTEELNEVLEFSRNETMPFFKKENTLIFKGQVDLYPHRVVIHEEIRNKIHTVSEFLTHERGRVVINEGNTQYQNPKKLLSRYRYQLVTNGAQSGHRISGTCRPLYMISTGGIIIYITLGKERREWWQYHEIPEEVIQYCNDVDKAIETIDNLENNLEYATELSNKGFKFAETYLTKENVEDYWLQLLNVYSSRCNFEITCPRGHHISSAEEAWSLL